MLRSQIRKRLPSYMIPKKIIRVEKIPLNKNGKTDRTQLLKNRLQTGAGRTPCLCEQSGSPG
jgi:acyl-CoA synthetase (AMP-forming)/AMP-acid ligase II